MALKQLGMASCLENIDAVPARGYCVVENGQSVHIPYPGGHEGRSFHHGRFVMALREMAKGSVGVDVIEVNVTDLVVCNVTRRVIGVHGTRRVGGATAMDGDKETFFADLVVVADGCFSNFRTSVMGDAGRKSMTKSHFVGAILEDAVLPIPNHGTVALVEGYGPVLLYQISKHDTRMLVDVKQPLPSDLKVCSFTFLRLTISHHNPRLTSWPILSLNFRQLSTSPSKPHSRRIAFAECPTPSFPLSNKVALPQKKVSSSSGTPGICGIPSLVEG